MNAMIGGVMRLFKDKGGRYASYVRTAVIAALFAAVAVPFGKRISADETAGRTDVPETRYKVVLNGEEVGYVSSEEDADSALLAARNLLNNKSEGRIPLVEADMDVVSDCGRGDTMSQDELAEDIYNNLSEKAYELGDDTAYTVRVGGFTVTLASKQEVTDLLEKVKSKYSDSDAFTVELVDNDNDVYDSMTTNFVSADKEINEAAKVLASENFQNSDSSSESTDGDYASDDTENATYKDGVLSVDFSEDVEVIQTKADKADIVSVDDAYELITKEHQEKEMYKVQQGDCLNGIAEAHGLTLDELLALNCGFTQDTLILPGDEIVVTVPASELSVVTVEETSYTEDYDAPVEYVDNDSWYVGTEQVVQQGSKGNRSVVALVTSVNGVPTDKQIINETVNYEAVPQIIERGTMTPPTYIRPVNGPITSYFGPRNFAASPYHRGIDIYVPSGTPVKASSSGTVVSAGWSGNYGYCVLIQHPNGTMTRYAHNSSIVVSCGQTVKQGQIISYSGATGLVTGPHVHFEILVGGVAVNPLNYLQ